MDERDQKLGIQLGSLKWLFEMELVDDPQVINHLKLNIFDISSHIKDVEILVSYHQRAVLVWIELRWFVKRFMRNRVETIQIECEERLKALLPRFKFRITDDRKIFDMSLDNVKKVLTTYTKGVNGEVSNSSDTITNSDKDKSQSDRVQDTTAVLSDKKESTEIE